MAAETGSHPIDGVQMPSWILRFDKHGACTSPRAREVLLQHLREQPRSDVIFFAHGWNNDFDDALAMYRDYLCSLEQLLHEHPAPRPFDPLFVGVVWPSICLSFDNGPQIAGSDLDGEPVERLTSDLVDRATGTSRDVGSIERIHALLARQELEADEAQELARLLAPAFGTLCDDDGTGAERITDPDDLIFVLRAMQQLYPRGVAAVLQDQDDWSESPHQVAARGATAAARDIQTAGRVSTLDPRMVLRLFSIYQMKDRAGIVGHHGVATLLRDLLASTASAGSAVHAVGHSFGCKVLLSAVCAPAQLARPLRSLLLLQPAVSHLCFAAHVPGTDRAGGYVAALQPERVTAPIYSTYSRNDMPLHDVFHLGLRRAGDLGEVSIAADGDTTAGRPPSRFAALGGYGPRGANQLLVDPMPAPGSAYPAAQLGTPIMAFDGSADIIDHHGDVTDANAAWALHWLMFR